MMKRLSKIALLAAAAFMLAGFPACFSDDGDEEEYPTLIPTTTNREPLADGTKTGRVATTAPSTAGTITLYKNGVSQGTKTSVAEALAAISTTGSDNWKIELAPGTYEATGLNYKGSANITIAGKSDKQYGTDVLIVGKGTDMTKESTRSLLSFEGSANVVIKNITLKNSHGETTGTAQAETIGVGPSSFTGTLAAYNCSFLSGQDTICTEGKAWFYKCYIEGDVDFIWIESKDGKVALYEDCIIRAIGSRTSKAYYTAPRLAVTNTVGKGVVIWKSSLQAEDALKEVYLGRNPWDKATDVEKGTDYFKDYYEQVAIVDTKFYSNNELNSRVWSGSGAHGTENQQFVGFKTCQKFAAPSPNDCGAAVLTQEQVAAEYSNRNYILNRVYNIAEETFENDSASNIWSLSALEEEFGANASESLPQKTFNPTSAKLTWNFAGTLNGNTIENNKYEGTCGTVTGTIEGSTDYTVKMHVNAQTGKFAARTTDTQVNAGTILTVPVTDGAIVSVTESSGTFGIEGTETITYTHSGAATGIVIYSSATSYLTKVAVSKLNLTALSDELKNATKTGEVRALTVSGADETEVGESITLTAMAYASYGAPVSSWSWKSSNANYATANSTTNTCSVSGVAEGSVIITATADGKSGIRNINVKPASTSTVVDEVVWDFKSTSLTWWNDKTCTNSMGQNQLEGTSKTAYIVGNKTGLPCVFHTDENGGKLSTQNGTGSQFYKGYIYIPVSTGSVVTINMHNNQTGYSHCTLSGTNLTAQNSSYTASSDGYVVLHEKDDSTGTYICEIYVTNVDKGTSRDISATPVSVTAQ